MNHINWIERGLNIRYIEKDYLKRQIYIKFLLKKLFLKSVSTSIYYELKAKKALKLICFGITQYKFVKYCNYSRITIQKSRCFKTGRGHMVFRAFFLSRLQIRELVRNGYSTHVLKAVF